MELELRANLKDIGHAEICQWLFKHGYHTVANYMLGTCDDLIRGNDDWPTVYVWNDGSKYVEESWS